MTFAEVVVDAALKALAAMPSTPEVWAVGERVHARLEDAGLELKGLFSVPNSVKAITPLVGQILIETEAQLREGEMPELYLFYNRPTSGAVYAPVRLTKHWQRTSGGCNNETESRCIECLGFVS